MNFFSYVPSSVLSTFCLYSVYSSVCVTSSFLFFCQMFCLYWSMFDPCSVYILSLVPSMFCPHSGYALSDKFWLCSVMLLSVFRLKYCLCSVYCTSCVLFKFRLCSGSVPSYKLILDYVSLVWLW